MFDTATKDGVGTCALYWAKRRAPFQCDSKKFPKSDKKETVSAAKLPPLRKDWSTEWNDVTNDWLGRMESKCKKFAWVGDFLNPLRLNGISLDLEQHKKHRAREAKLKTPSKTRWNGLAFKVPIPKWLRKMDDEGGSYAERIVCTEDSYKEEARGAFYPMMSTKWFPPQIEKKGDSLEVSCGGNEVQLDVYSKRVMWADYTYGVKPFYAFKDGAVSIAKATRQDPVAYLGPRFWITKALSPEGKDVTGSFEAFKMDGGYSEAKPGMVGFNNEGDAFKGITALAKARRKPAPKRHASPWGNPGKDQPIMTDDIRLVGSDPRNYEGGIEVGPYRNNLSGKTNHCCPPKGLPADMNFISSNAPRGGMAQSNRKPEQWRASRGSVANPCYRGLYGVTKSCKADLKIRILTCKSCGGCSAPRGAASSAGGQHVHVDIQHVLKKGRDEDVEGCKAWFTFADTAVRNYVASTRMKVINQKLGQCPKLG
jgi:hypothetical protein